VNGVLAQRLVRVLCKHCKRPSKLGPKQLKQLGLTADEADTATIFEPVGCEHCKQTGFSGRTAIHELFVLSPELQKAILDGADANQLNEQARANGMATLLEDGMLKVQTGMTSIDEVLRVTQDQVDLELD
jgi:general secretion pathway protein E